MLYCSGKDYNQRKGFLQTVQFTFTHLADALVQTVNKNPCILSVSLFPEIEPMTSTLLMPTELQRKYISKHFIAGQPGNFA